MKVVLASSSVQRQNILKMLGLKYEVITSDVEEFSREVNPSKYVEELSLNKAKSVSDKVDSQALIIAADTIIYCNDKKYEKPKTKEEAINNMKELSGKKSVGYTGVTIIDLYKNKTLTTSSKVTVYLKKLEEQEINWYVNHEENVLKCCGYVPIGKAAFFIKKIDGDYNTLIGLSPNVLYEMLKKLGYSLQDLEFFK